MNYLDLGFNDFLIRPLKATYTEQIGIDTGGSIGQVSGNQVRGDQIVSLNRRLNIDLQNNSFTINDNKVNRVELGGLSDDNIGIIIRNDEGNEMLKVSGSENYLKSSDGRMVIDFNKGNIIISDETGTPRIAMGNI